VKSLDWRQFSPKWVQSVDWRFVINAVSVCVFQFISFIMSFVVLCVGIANLPGSDFTAIRTMAQQNLALMGIDALWQFSIVSSIAISSGMDAARIVVNSLRQNYGLEKDERLMMVRCAAVGWSLIQVDTEGYVAVAANPATAPVRLYRWDDLQNFVSAQEEAHAPDSDADLLTRLHAAA